MPLKIIKQNPITVPEVKQILETLGREPSQFQRKTLDYASTFSKIEAKEAGELLLKLKEKFGLEAVEAVQLVNNMPETIEEIRTFFPRHKVIETEKLQEILALILEYRKK